MKSVSRCLPPLLLALVLCDDGQAKARKIDDYHWTGVERVVAIGDLHGDYEQYIKVMREAGLINSRNRWTGGKTHLVQTGDVPDRGPSTRDIIEHLGELKIQAERKGGAVHTLIGNHEAMNSYGDLRYVDAGEFAAFKGPNSKRYREAQWNFTLQRIEALRPEEFLVMDLDQYRLEWEKRIPLGWVEHRIAWQPSGRYGQWVLGNPVAIKVNDTIFLHGGLSASYCRFSLRELTDQVHAGLENFDPQQPGILEDPEGPLWYRGLAMEQEDALGEILTLILERYEAGRIVVGHTPTGGIVWPRFDGRVVVNDTGISAYYGAHDAYLELTDDGAFAGYGDRRMAMPQKSEDREAYLREVLAIGPGNEVLQRRLARMLAPPVEAVSPDEAVPPDEAAPLPDAESPESLEAETPDAGEEPVSPDICR